MQWEKVKAQDLPAAVKKSNGDFFLVRSFLHLLPNPAFIKDKKGRLLYINPSAEKIWNVRQAEAIGRSRASILEVPGLDPLDNDLRVLRTNSARVFVQLMKEYREFCVQFTFSDRDGDRLIAGIVVKAGTV